MPALTVHNAEIKTATVEIKALAISGKQVTLAVFRQLQEESLINRDGSLAGIPWGIVNYHPDKCADDETHLHVVWQRGSELLRSAIKTSVQTPDFRSKVGAAFVESCVYDLAATGETRFSDVLPPLNELGRYQLRDDIPGVVLNFENGIKARVVLSRQFQTMASTLVDLARSRDHVEQSRDDETKEAYRKTVSRIEQHLQVQMETVAPRIESFGSTTERLHIIFTAEVSAEAARRKRWSAAREALADLPQLFIAV